MKLAKKSLAVLAGMTCVASMTMTGCGGNNATTTNATPAASEAPASEAPASEAPAASETASNGVDLSEHITISWYQAGATEPEDLAKIEEAANKYIAENTNLNCDLKLNFFDFGTFPEKMNTMINSGEEFDICFTCNWCNDYTTQAGKGAYVDITDMLGEYAPQTKEMLGEGFVLGSQINGRNYAIPANKEKAHQWGLVIRKDIADKYNMDFSNVKTLADMEPFFQTIKENEPGMYALEACEGESAKRLLDYDYIGSDSMPGAVYNDDASVVFNQVEKPEMKELFELMHRYYEAGYIREDAPSVTDYQVDQKAGKIFAAVRSLKPGKAAEESKTFNHDYIQVELTDPIISNRETTGSMEAISVTSKHPERALMLLELFNTDVAFNNLINFGIEGEHYTKVEGTENIIAEGPNNSKYNINCGWALGNQLINYIWDSEPLGAEKWDKFEEFNNAAKNTQTLGFIYQSDEVQSQIAQCTNVWKQYMPSLETGAVDPETVLPEFIESLKAANVDDIIADKQAQLDAWKSGK